MVDSTEAGPNQLFDFAPVGQTLLVDCFPGLLDGRIVGIQLMRQCPEMLASVIEIDICTALGKC